jgi:hypothetical protein
VKLPVNISSRCCDLKGRFYRWEVKAEPTENLDLYPEGVKAVFRLLRLDAEKEKGVELLILIDNHPPYGFHEHDRLPHQHDSRALLETLDWEEALMIFQGRCREVLKCD